MENLINDHADEKIKLFVIASDAGAKQSWENVKDSFVAKSAPPKELSLRGAFCATKQSFTGQSLDCFSPKNGLRNDSAHSGEWLVNGYFAGVNIPC